MGVKLKCRSTLGIRGAGIGGWRILLPHGRQTAALLERGIARTIFRMTGPTATFAAGRGTTVTIIKNPAATAQSVVRGFAEDECPTEEERGQNSDYNQQD